MGESHSVAAKIYCRTCHYLAFNQDRASRSRLQRSDCIRRCVAAKIFCRTCHLVTSRNQLPQHEDSVVVALQKKWLNDRAWHTDAETAVESVLGYCPVAQFISVPVRTGVPREPHEFLCDGSTPSTGTKMFA